MKIEITNDYIKIEHNGPDQERLLDYWFEILHYNSHFTQKIYYESTKCKQLFIKRKDSKETLEWKKRKPKNL